MRNNSSSTGRARPNNSISTGRARPSRRAANSEQGLDQSRSLGAPGRTRPTLLLLVISASSLSAHPGHDLGAYGAWHIVTSPYHFVTLSAIAILLWWAARFIQHRLTRRWLQIGALATIACAALLWLAGV